MRRRTTQPNRRRQHGGSTLAVGLILMALATLITLWSTRIALLEQAVAGNEYKSQQALQAAESGLGYARMVLQRALRQMPHGLLNEQWNDCTTQRPAWHSRALNSLCGTTTAWLGIDQLVDTPLLTAAPYTAFRAHLLASRDQLSAATVDRDLLLTIVAEGGAEIPADGGFDQARAFAAVRITVVASELLISLPPAPLVVAGKLQANPRELHLVVNPNGAGRGVALAAWGAALTANSFTACQAHEYFSSGQPFVAVGDPGGSGRRPFLFDHPGNPVVQCDDCSCPESLSAVSSQSTVEPMRLLFGLKTGAHRLLSMTANTIPGCEALDATSSGFYRVAGDCRIDGQAGSAAAPVLLAVEGKLKLADASSVFGLVLLTPPADRDQSPTAASVEFGRDTRIYGSLVAAADLTINSLGGHIVYSLPTLRHLQRGLTELAVVPGSWADYWPTDS